MGSNKLVGKVLVTARHIPSTQIVETTILFEDRGDSIYYCWTFKDSLGSLIVSKCLSVSKRIIDIDEFDYSINHSKFSIDNYRISRQKIFEVIEMQKR